MTGAAECEHAPDTATARTMTGRKVDPGRNTALTVDARCTGCGAWLRRVASLPGCPANPWLPKYGAGL